MGKVLLIGIGLENEAIQEKVALFAKKHGLTVVKDIEETEKEGLRILRDISYAQDMIREPPFDVGSVIELVRPMRLHFDIPDFSSWTGCGNLTSYVPRFGTHNQNFDTIIKTSQDRLKKSEGFKKIILRRKSFMEMQNCSNFRRMK